MSGKVILQFIGQRRRDFTVQGPVTEKPYYVQPESGEPVVFDAADSEAILKRDPLLWEPATKSVAKPMSEAPQEDTFPVEPPLPKKPKG
jgi:hypothetical protein